MNGQISDTEFYRKLEDFLEGGVVGIFYNQDATINRDKTLALPCYEGFAL